MATHDAKAFAHLNLYDILNLDALCDQKDIDRAWRKFALKYHPDKVSKEKAADAQVIYDQGRIGKEILSDPTAKQIYDEARATRERKRQQDELLDARRRKLKDDLDRRERGVKRAFDGEPAEVDEATRLEREVQRIAADGKRRRLEKEGQLREERQRKLEEREKAKQSEATKPVPELPRSSIVEEIDRTVRARFRRNATTQSIDSERIRTIFTVFGSVENTFMMKDKREKIPGSKEKLELGRCGITFTSILGAYDAVEEWQREQRSDTIWEEFVDVSWVGGREPKCISDLGDGQSSSILSEQETTMIRLKKAARQ